MTTPPILSLDMTPLLLPDILVPQLWIRGDELGHQAHALLVVQDDHVDAPGSEVLLRSLEGPVFADHDPGYFVEEDRAAAHVAGGKSRVQHRPAVILRLEPARVLQAVHLGV